MPRIQPITVARARWPASPSGPRPRRIRPTARTAHRGARRAVTCAHSRSRLLSHELGGARELFGAILVTAPGALVARGVEQRDACATRTDRAGLAHDVRGDVGLAADDRNRRRRRSPCRRRRRSATSTLAPTIAVAGHGLLRRRQILHAAVARLASGPCTTLDHRADAMASSSTDSSRAAAARSGCRCPACRGSARCRPGRRSTVVTVVVDHGGAARCVLEPAGLVTGGGARLALGGDACEAPGSARSRGARIAKRPCPGGERVRGRLAGPRCRPPCVPAVAAARGRGMLARSVRRVGRRGVGPVGARDERDLIGAGARRAAAGRSRSRARGGVVGPRRRAVASAARPAGACATTEIAEHDRRPHPRCTTAVAARALPCILRRAVRRAHRGLARRRVAVPVALGAVARAARRGARRWCSRWSRRCGCGCGCRASAHARVRARPVRARRAALSRARRARRRPRDRERSALLSRAGVLTSRPASSSAAERLLAVDRRCAARRRASAPCGSNNRACAALAAGGDPHAALALVDEASALRPDVPGAAAHARHGAARGRSRRRRDRGPRRHARRRRAAAAPRSRALPRPRARVDAEGRGGVRRGLPAARRRARAA